MTALKTVKQDEPISRSRFVDCPVCKNHTLKVKRTVQVGRCKSCSETYKVIVVYVKTGRKTKPSNLTMEPRPEAKVESKPESVPESSLPSLQLPSDSSLFGSTSESYSGLSEAVFGETHKDKPSETGSSSSQ
jgi:ribosomal protein S27E